MVPVTVTGRVTDDENYASGINPSTAAYAVTDDYGKVEPAGPIQLQPDGTYAFVILLQASRLATDFEGRQYTITVTAQDRAGNTGSAATYVIVPHDRGDRGDVTLIDRNAESPPKMAGPPNKPKEA